MMTNALATLIRYAVGVLAVLALIAAVALLAPLAAEAAGPGTTSSVTITRADGTLTAIWPAVTGAATYHVTYSSTGGASWELAALDHPADTGTSGNESITFAVDNAKTYIVGVRAKNADGGGGWRNSPAEGPFTPPTPTPTPTPAPTPDPTPAPTPDPTPAPAPPGTTSAVTTSRDDGTLTASWHAVANAATYHVTYTADNGASWSLAALDHPAGGGATESITIDGVANDETYIVGVRAKNAHGAGGWRNSPTAPTYKPPTGVDPPPPPASVTVTRADGTVTATWPAVSEADGYHVGSSTDLGESWFREATDHTETSITFSANNDLTYRVSVMAVNDGGGSEWFDSAPALPFDAPPARPTGLRATADDESVALTWDDPSDTSITGYEYRMRAAPPAPGWGAWTAIPGSDSTTASFTVEGLTNGTEYRFKLRAVDNAGESPPAPADAPWYVAATPAIQPPGQPQGMEATGTDGGANITWTNPNDPSITGYQIQQKEDGGAWGGQTPIEGSGAGTTSHQVGGLTPGTTYHFNLQALNAGGASRGAQASAAVPARLPGPADLTVTARGTGTLTATWTAVPGAWKYFISSSNSGDEWKNFTPEDSITGTSVTLSNRNDALNYTVLVWAATDYGHTLRTESYPAGTLTSPTIAPESVSLSRSGTTLTASWPAVVGAANYNVDLSSDGGSTWVGQATAITTTTWTKSSIDATTSYAVRVQTKNNAGTSGWTESNVSTPAPPAPDSVTLGTRTADTLNVSWSAVTGAASYNVRSSTDDGVTWGASSSETGTTKALTVDSTKDYFVGVQAVNSAGTSGWTVSSKSFAIPLPPAPANLAATRGKGSITLTWDAAAGADTYDIACSVFGGNIWEVCKTGMTDADRSATITQMYNATAKKMGTIYDKRDYLFAVRGKNASGNGEWTRLTVWPAVPDQIASVTATSRDADGITLSMTAPVNNGGYVTNRIEVDCRTSSDGGTTWSGWFACTDAQGQDPTPGATFTTDIDSIDNYDSTLAYQARARARNGLGAAWDWRVSAAIHTVPGAPTINNYLNTILAWSEPSDTGSGPGPLTYNVYCRAQASGAWTKVVDGLTVQVGQTSHITSLFLRPTCTNANSQVAITIVNGFESARAYWPRTSLAASGVTVTGATLTIANNHSGSTWYYKADVGPDATCQGPVSTSSETLTGLTGGTTYTYKAYSDSACSTANLLATATAFTTTEITLTAGSIGTTSATLTLANHTGNWYAKKTAPSTGTCSSAISGATHDLSSLTAGTWYTYRAYSDSGCTTANELASEAFSTAVTVSNLSESNAATLFQVGFGGQFAQEFTAGSAAGGYTLKSVTLNFAYVFNADNVTVTLRNRLSNGQPDLTATLATLSGTPATGDSTFTCSGSGCALAKGTQYFIHVAGASGSNDAAFNTTTSNAQALQPSGNGWSIADAARYSNGAWGEYPQSISLKMSMTAVPKPGLAASSVTTTTATLTLTGHVGDWWLKPSSGTCAAGESDFSHALSSLTAGTQYTYTAYSDSACSTGKAIGSATFATPPGVPTNVSVGNSWLSGTTRDYPVSWGKPSGAQASDAFAYQVQCTDTNDRNTTDWGDCGTQNVASTANASVSKTVQHGWFDSLFQYVRVRAEKHGVYSAWVIQKTQYGS